MTSDPVEEAGRGDESIDAAGWNEPQAATAITANPIASLFITCKYVRNEVSLRPAACYS